MAIIRITRAHNVRKYNDYEIDTDDLTPDQRTAIIELTARGDIDKDGKTLKTLSSIIEDMTDTREDIGEESDDPQTAFIYTDAK